MIRELWQKAKGWVARLFGRGREAPREDAFQDLPDFADPLEDGGGARSVPIPEFQPVEDVEYRGLPDAIRSAERAMEIPKDGPSRPEFQEPKQEQASVRPLSEFPDPVDPRKWDVSEPAKQSSESPPFRGAPGPEADSLPETPAVPASDAADRPELPQGAVEQSGKDPRLPRIEAKAAKAEAVAEAAEPKLSSPEVPEFPDATGFEEFGELPEVPEPGGEALDFGTILPDAQPASPAVSLPDAAALPRRQDAALPKPPPEPSKVDWAKADAQQKVAQRAAARKQSRQGEMRERGQVVRDRENKPAPEGSGRIEMPPPEHVAGEPFQPRNIEIEEIARPAAPTPKTRQARQEMGDFVTQEFAQERFDRPAATTAGGVGDRDRKLDEILEVLRDVRQRIEALENPPPILRL